jgi:hypothetical protein
MDSPMPQLLPCDLLDMNQGFCAKHDNRQPITKEQELNRQR